jgi:hypothetical protein
VCPECGRSCADRDTILKIAVSVRRSFSDVWRVVWVSSVLLAGVYVALFAFMVAPSDPFAVIGIGIFTSVLFMVLLLLRGISELALLRALWHVRRGASRSRIRLFKKVLGIGVAGAALLIHIFFFLPFLYRF